MFLGTLPASAAGPGQTSGGPIQIGHRVRVSEIAEAARVTGTLVAIDDKVLRIASKERELEIPRSQIAKLEQWRGKKSHWLAGLGVGAVVGGLSTIPFCSGWCSSDGEALGSVVALAGIGAAGGALIGAIIRTDRWETVRVPPVSIGAAPLPGRGAVFALRLTF
jgi:hypothetical protein